jgi:hypothetical protein
VTFSITLALAGGWPSGRSFTLAPTRVRQPPIVYFAEPGTPMSSTSVSPWRSSARGTWRASA